MLPEASEEIPEDCPPEQNVVAGVAPKEGVAAALAGVEPKEGGADVPGAVVEPKVPA